MEHLHVESVTGRFCKNTSSPPRATPARRPVRQLS